MSQQTFLHQLGPQLFAPHLADRKGKATFIGTPKGKNEFWEIWHEAQRRSQLVCTAMFKASETSILDQEELDEARRDNGR